MSDFGGEVLPGSSACADVVVAKGRIPADYSPSDEEEATERGWRLKGRDEMLLLSREWRAENRNVIGGIDIAHPVGLIIDKELQGHPGAQDIFTKAMRWADVNDDELDTLIEGVHRKEAGEAATNSARAQALVESSVAARIIRSCCSDLFREIASWCGGHWSRAGRGSDGCIALNVAKWQTSDAPIAEPPERSIPDL